MIMVKMLGGAKKVFDADGMNIDMDGITVAKLLDVLDGLKPKGSEGIEPKNTLVAINGSEISALGGMNAVIRSGDTVSIIPVVHGGAVKLQRASFDIKGTHLEAYWIGRTDGDAGSYIDAIRKNFPKLLIQAVASECILGYSHVEKIVAISLAARKNGSLLAKKLETDMLLRFAATTQISKAIEHVGAKSDRGFVLLAMGSIIRCKKLYSEISKEVIACTAPPHRDVAKKFGILKKEEASCDGSLEDVLAERAAVLV